MFKIVENLKVGDFVILVGKHYRVEKINYNSSKDTYTIAFRRIKDNIL